MLDYIYDMEAEQYSFVRVPKLLLQHETYQRITPEAKLLYSLLLDRVGISLRSGWKDKQDRVYIIYPIAEIMEEMNCGKNKAVQLLDKGNTNIGSFTFINMFLLSTRAVKAPLVAVVYMDQKILPVK